MTNPLDNERQSLNNASGRRANPDPPPKRAPTADLEELKKRSERK